MSEQVVSFSVKRDPGDEAMVELSHTFPDNSFAGLQVSTDAIIETSRCLEGESPEGRGLGQPGELAARAARAARAEGPNSVWLPAGIFPLPASDPQNTLASDLRVPPDTFQGMCIT